MTFPSSCAPLTGISRARLPAWALPDGWPTQANGEPLLADLAFRDGRIAALTPTDQPTPGLWDLAGPDAPRPGGTPCPSGQDLYH
jgi:cytosine deaminase